MAEAITLHHVGPDDLDRLLAVGPGLFDNPIRPDQAAAFLDDPLHELILACDGARAVGMVSANILLHPDKAPAMFINELGVRESHQRRGIATRLMKAMIDLGRTRGCQGIWLGTEEDNAAALALYRGIAQEEVKGSFFGWDDGI